MREKDRIINSLLDYAAGRMREGSIYVINDDSEKEAVKTVKNYPGVKLIDAKEALDTLNWKLLLPILNLDKRPKGKGTTVLAGYLFQQGLSQVSQGHSQWIFHSDADIENCAVFQPLEYLAWGAAHGPKEAIHIKIAKAGRNNECSMAARNTLLMLESLGRVVEDWESDKIAERAKILFENLAPYKWMLGGAFGLTWEAAMHRPLATGYLDETLICAFCEDFARAHNYQTVQVANPNPCLDAENDFQKENIIVQLASNFVLTLASAQKSVNEWGIGEIKRINRDLMSNPVKMAFIPKEGDEDPVRAEVVANERILPSVKMLNEAGLIDKRRLYALIEKMGC